MRKLLVILLVICLGFSLMGCEESNNTEAQKRDQEMQGAMLSKAQTVEPAYQINNFLSRKAINDWLERVDVVDKEWYVYIHAPISGEILGYYVSSTIPLSYGVGLSNPQQIV